MKTKICSKAFSTLAIACFLSIACLMVNVNAVEIVKHPVNGTYIGYNYDTEGEVIQHSFILTSSGTVTINVQTEFSASAYVYNANGENDYCGNAGIHGTPNDPKTETFKLDLEAGNYYIKINSSEYADLTTGIYRVKITQEASGATEVEPNDSFAQAMTLNREALVTGFISSDNTNDFYKISLPADEKIALSMILYNSAVDVGGKSITIYNADYEEVANYPFYVSNAPGTDTKEIELKKGVYYFKVHNAGYHMYTGKYQIRWKKAPVYVSALSVSGKKSVVAGKKITLKVDVTPADVDNKTVRWGSSDTSVATVNSAGVVTGKKIGKVIITATSTDGTDIEARHTIYVAPKKVENLKATAKGSKKVQLRWKKQNNITGIQVQYAKKKNFKNAKKKTVRTTATATKATVKLAKGTYYIKVRAFAKLDGKTCYGDWSNAKKIKIK